jgi:A/G-specific adenine glycosylase
MTTLSTFSSDILAWYDQHKRTLPWRSDSPDPYAVWISEVMLQQTTVKSVIAYYYRWMERFPTVQTLAESSIDNVLHLWAGLGYYSRARNIHKAAKVIVDDCSGVFPSSVNNLTKLPGIGKYTAGAIASIAFGQQAATVDANISRILARVHGVKRDSNFDKQIWQIADSLVPDHRAGDYNQALMDIGSAICTSKNPICTLCPISTHCKAYKSGEPETFPGDLKPKDWNIATHVCLALLYDGRVLVGKRPSDEGLWRGLWEMPRVVVNNCDDKEAANLLASEIGLNSQTLKKFANIKHVVTNNKITLICYMIHVDNVELIQLPTYSEIAWVDRVAADKLGFSAPQKKLIEKLTQAGYL